MKQGSRSVALAVILSAAIASAQSPTPVPQGGPQGGRGGAPGAAARAQAEPKFDVATVKVRKSGTPMHLYDCSGDRFQLSGPRLTDVLLWIYDLRGDENRRFGRSVPSVVGDEYYDIQAKAPQRIETESQCRAMAEQLLADRFKLKVHWEDKEAEVFELVVARGGAKLRAALPTDEGSDVNIVVDGMPRTLWVPPAEREARAGIKGITMQELASMLGTNSPVSVTDKTHLQGRYQIDLRYSVGLTVAPTGVSDPPLDAALNKLGLRLERRNGTVKVPVLDHIEAPDEN